MVGMLMTILLSQFLQVLIVCSFLYQLLNDYKDSYRKLTCLHVNHGVRSASNEEARFLEAYCDRHHIDLHIKSWICRIVSIEITAFRMKLELNVTNGLMK